MIGQKVLLIDGDYYAPCLDTYFPKNKENKPFTSYLTGECEFKEVIAKTPIKNLYISHSPNPDVREAILQADVRTHGRYLKQILLGKEVAEKELDFQHLIIDNTGGISIPSINHLSCSNRSVIVVRPIYYAIKVTYEFLKSIYTKLRHIESEEPRRDVVVWNQVPVKDEERIEPWIQEYIDQWSQKFGEAGVIFGTIIPYQYIVATSMIDDRLRDINQLYKLLEPHITQISMALKNEAS